jgi:hypothetical protein
MFLFLGLLSLIPIIAIFAGLLILIPAIQMVIGYREPRLPGSLSTKKLEVKKLNKMNKKVIPWIEKIEIYVLPRWILLTKPFALRIMGLMIIGLALLIIVPLPFTNVISAVSLVLFSLGLLEKDGLFMFFGMILGIVSYIVGYLIIRTAIMVFFG